MLAESEHAARLTELQARRRRVDCNNVRLELLLATTREQARAFRREQDRRLYEAAAVRQKVVGPLATEVSLWMEYEEEARQAILTEAESARERLEMEHMVVGAALPWGMDDPYADAQEIRPDEARVHTARAKMQQQKDVHEREIDRFARRQLMLTEKIARQRGLVHEYNKARMQSLESLDSLRGEELILKRDMKDAIDDRVQQLYDVQIGRSPRVRRGEKRPKTKEEQEKEEEYQKQRNAAKERIAASRKGKMVTAGSIGGSPRRLQDFSSTKKSLVETVGKHSTRDITFSGSPQRSVITTSPSPMRRVAATNKFATAMHTAVAAKKLTKHIGRKKALGKSPTTPASPLV